MATIRPPGASMPMPKDCATIHISTIRIVEISGNTNTYNNPMLYTGDILTRPNPDFQGIYLRIFISDVKFLILLGISFASFSHFFILARSHLS